MTDPDRITDDLEPAELRKICSDLLAIFSQQQAAMGDEHSAMARWLVASLLILNGGALLAVFDRSTSLTTPILDAAPFVLGTLLALLVGVMIQWANQAAGRIIGEVVGLTMIGAATGRLNDGAAATLAEVDTRIAREGKWPIRMGWASAGMFAVGAIITGLDRAPIDVAAVARCEAIQRDMLSARPRRKDGPDLFQALGCRPHGEGNVYAPANPLPGATARIGSPDDI